MSKSIQEEILATLWFIVGLLSYGQNFKVGWVLALLMGVVCLIGAIYYTHKELNDDKYIR